MSCLILRQMLVTSQPGSCGVEYNALTEASRQKTRQASNGQHSLRLAAYGSFTGLKAAQTCSKSRTRL